MKTVPAALALIVMTPAYHAEVQAQSSPPSLRGAALLASCRTNEPACGAYLQGVLDMMIAARKAECGAPRSDRKALASAYVRWAERNSYFMSVNMVAGARNALAEAWPCRPVES